MTYPALPWHRELATHPLQLELRPVASRDVSGLLILDQVLAEEDMTSADGIESVPRNEAEMRIKLTPWWQHSSSIDKGIYLVVAVSVPSGTIPILASGELHRLPVAKMRHVGVLSVGVHPEFRRRGLGQAIVEGLISWAEAHNITRIELYVRQDNHAARALYTKLGFTLEGQRHHSIQLPNGTLMDDLIMARVSSLVASR
ncbi:MAG: GNAT family N-acetyltransferase [Myxococcales bacterium]|nr:GNAT family N-acetyltransferase [Myxococcales bacterium]